MSFEYELKEKLGESRGYIVIVAAAIFVYLAMSQVIVAPWAAEPWPLETFVQCPL